MRWGNMWQCEVQLLLYMKRTEKHWELERNQTGNDTQSRVILSFKFINLSEENGGKISLFITW